MTANTAEIRIRFHIVQARDPDLPVAPTKTPDLHRGQIKGMVRNPAVYVNAAMVVGCLHIILQIPG